MPRWPATSAIAFLTLLLAATVGRSDDESAIADTARTFDAQIARLDAQDPRAPQALQTHLRYAAYLVKESAGDCAARLAAAQAQLQAAQQSVALDVLLPQGSARAADLAYQIHAALADCGDAADSARRDREWRAALEFAQHAAALYADTFDYPAMLTMQFNVAVTYQNLGDKAQFDAALKSLLEGDRQYGFPEDAEENLRLLAHGSPGDYSALTADFPHRSIALHFDWVPGNNAITLNSESVRVVGEALAHARGDRTLTRHVRKRLFGWTVTYDSLGSHFSHDPVGSIVESSFMASFATILTRFHDFSLTSTRSGSGARTADFRATVNDGPFKARVLKDAQSFAAGGITAELGSRLKAQLSSSTADLYTALDYNLETGAWPEATLDQGQWYGMELLLPLPYDPLHFLRHQVQFAFTRELPCSADSNRTCAELVVRAVPKEADLTYAMRELSMHLQHGQTAHAWSTMSMRLVTDPSTLQTYRSEIRQFFYLWVEGAAKDSPLGPLLGADRTEINSSPVRPAAE